MFGCKNQRCPIRRIFGHPSLPTGEAAVALLDEAAREFKLSTGETLTEASESRPLAMVFLRHFGCTFTRQLLRGLASVEDCARKHGAELVLVHMLKNGEEIPYLGEGNRITRIADPQCTLYRAFGLGKGGLLELFGPRVWWLAAVSIFKGCGVGHLAGDGLQMPGAFLFHRGRIIAAQRAASASDLPDLPALFHATAENPSPTTDHPQANPS